MRIHTALAFMASTTLMGAAGAVPPPVAAPSGQKTLAATLNVYVFPGNGQNSSQQSKEETECYNWAVQNTGSDPFQVAQQTEQQKQQAAQQQQQVAQATQGAGAKGAVRGAAAGALVGEVANNDAGSGAAWGAAAGVVAGRRKARGAQQQVAQQTAAQTQATEQDAAQRIDAFKKAFAACLEAKSFAAQIARDQQDAAAAGITGTPMFVLGRANGTNVTGLLMVGAKPLATFEAEIEKLLSNK